MDWKQEISDKFIFLTADAPKQGSGRHHQSVWAALFSLFENVNICEWGQWGAGYTNWDGQ